MSDNKYDKLIGFLELLEKDNIGEWITDENPKDTKDAVIRLPYPKYSETVTELIAAVYEFAQENPEYELINYREQLEKRGIDDYEDADVSNMDAKGIMALFMAMVRSERFCAGMIMEMIKSGTVKQWLLRLKELSQMQ